MNCCRPQSILINWILLFSSLVPAASGKDATLKATCRSVAQEPIFWSLPGVGSIATYFTTYDGKATLPLADTVSGSTVFGGELRPAEANTYQSDYLNFSPTLGILAYGSGTVHTAQNDSDGNTIPDIFQFDKGGTLQFGGILRADFPSVVQYTMAGAWQKQANQTLISSDFTITDSSGVAQHFIGRLLLGYFTGGASYSRNAAGPGTITLTLRGNFGDESPITYTGTAPFTVLNSEQVFVPALMVRREDGFSLKVSPMVLTRHGKTYVADMEVEDGNLTTSWQDYKSWVLEMTDNNDSDGNSIPDFSDSVAVPPVIVTQPQSQALKLGSTLTLFAAASGQPTPTFRWQFNGSNLLGATGPSLVIGNLQKANLGAYRVIVSNSAGTATSAEALITDASPAPLKLRLSLGARGTLRISWPVEFTGFVLEMSTGTVPVIWSPAPGTVGIIGSENVMIEPRNQKMAWFRLKR
jgi:hypothetical protein